MPMPTVEKSRVTSEVGDPNSTLSAFLDGVWDAWVQYQYSDELRYLYTKRSALYLRLAEEVPSTDLNVEGEISDAQSQRYNHLMQMATQVQTDIDKKSMIFRSTGGSSAAGAITKVTPESPCWPGAVDPNWEGLSGSAFVRGRRGW